MSNRVLGILIILWFIGAGYIYYHLIYIPAQLEEKKQQELEVQNLKVIEKQPKLVLQDTENIEVSSTPNTKKIEELKDRKNSYYYLSLWAIGDIKFLENNNKLDLFLEDEYLGSFQKVEKWEIEVQRVVNNSDYLFLVLWKDRFLYNLRNKSVTDIELNIQVEYVKVWKDISEFLFKTTVWIFAYSLIAETIEYVHFFKDFVYFIDDSTGKYGYIWVVHEVEENKIQNLWLNNLISGDNFESLVVFYSPISKEKNILLESDLRIANIYTQDSDVSVDVFVIDEFWEKYKLENI